MRRMRRVRQARRIRQVRVRIRRIRVLKIADRHKLKTLDFKNQFSSNSIEKLF